MSEFSKERSRLPLAFLANTNPMNYAQIGADIDLVDQCRTQIQVYSNGDLSWFCNILLGNQPRQVFTYL